VSETRSLLNQINREFQESALYSCDEADPNGETLANGYVRKLKKQLMYETQKYKKRTLYYILYVLGFLLVVFGILYYIVASGQLVF